MYWYFKLALGRGFDSHLEHRGPCSCNSEVRVRVLWLNLFCITAFCPAGVMPYDEISVAIVYVTSQALCTWWSRLKVIPSPLGTVRDGWFWVWWLWNHCKLYYAQQELGGRWRSKTKEIPLGTVGVGDFTYPYACLMFVYQATSKLYRMIGAIWYGYGTFRVNQEERKRLMILHSEN